MKHNFFINRIKLLNFHNFSNVTVELNHGGHLFLLGDNGSGKTTVLDAIHYVLTAGEYMEFNAAARVTGNKHQGRRAQGIITRYNVDTGHLRPTGGVTYAAVEIMGDNGKITTVAIGMSVNSPDDSLNRWGIIRDGKFEDIPFLIAELDGERPRDKQEMKKVLGGVGYFGQPHSFCNLLAERFLGGRAKFKDFCRFLAMGKAYREIAAQTTDYQALFMRLLPESDQDIFERIIITLRSIDESRSQLDTLAGNLNYIRELIALRDSITDDNCHAIAFETVELLIKITHLQQNIDDDEQAIEAWQVELKQLADELLQQKSQELTITARLNELQSRDPSGALIKEKELQDWLKLALERQQVEQVKLKTQQHSVVELEQSHQTALARLQSTLGELMKKLPEKSIKTGIETGSTLQAIEALLHHENSETEALEPVLSQLLDDTRQIQTKKQTSLAMVKSRLEIQQTQADEIATEEQRLLTNAEAMPEWNSFPQLIEDLDQAAIVYTPLYKGLEWHPDLTSETKAQIEEFIGEELLAVITVTTAEYERAAEIIFNDYPGQRLALIEDTEDAPASFRQWATMIFDINACNPLLLKILLQALSAKTLPEFATWQHTEIVRFRGHERSFCGNEARFVGAESRALEQRRKIKAIRHELKDIRQLVKTTDKELKELKSLIRLLQNLDKLINQALGELRKSSALVNELTLKSEHANETLARLNLDCQTTKDDISTQQAHLKSLRKLIADDDLEAIEQQLAAVDAQLKQCQETIATQQTASAKIAVRQEDAEVRVATAEKNLTEEQTAYNEKLFLLTNRYQRSEPKAWIEELRSTNRLHVEQDAAKRANKYRLAASEHLAELKHRINDIAGASYGFSYDQANYQLFSRANINADAIAESLAKNLAEQQSLITDKTTELFSKLIMDTMIRTLYEKVHALEQMQREINRLLEGRSFGNNSYRIKIKPHDHYSKLVKLIKSFTHYNPDDEQNIRDFFADYRDELINTPPGIIPEILDYRNWYRYEMCVYSNAGVANAEGAVMNSRVKSVGSGGEQAVPNYLLVLTIAHFMFKGSNIKLNTLLFDEAFYGIDAQRRDQLMGFASDLGLQLFVASPDQDGVKDEIAFSTSLLVVKDADYEVHLFPFQWSKTSETDMFEPETETQLSFAEEL
ncbi:MAG: AAA family ATPase [Victivallaceae bacterium]|nr:AAA family ATPase [Victivallaceae bacterium]